MHKIRESLILGYTEVHRGDGSVSLVAPKLGKNRSGLASETGRSGGFLPRGGQRVMVLGSMTLIGRK